MSFQFAHYNYNVMDLEKSIKFYEEALGLREVRRKEAEDGSFILAYLGDGKTGFELELTWLRDWERIITIWVTMKSILHLLQMIWKHLTGNMKKWDASVLKIRQWVSILLMIRTDTGWRSYLKNLDEGKCRHAKKNPDYKYRRNSFLCERLQRTRAGNEQRRYA